MDLESTSERPLYYKSPPPTSVKSSNRKRNMCLAAVAALAVIVLILIVLGLTVFKAKRPQINVDSVALSDFHLSFDVAPLGVNLNITLALGLSVKNPNRVGFKYKNSSAFVRYRGKVVGEVPIPQGKISAGQTKPMNLSLVLMGNRLITDSNLYSDVIAGKLSLSSFTRMSGKVRILFFNVHVVSSTTCDLVVNVGSASISNQTCNYKTKL